MHQSQNLSLQQVLAPQLQQSLLILQAPLLELRNLVQQEMETNPVLEELATEIGSDEGEEPKSESAPAEDNFKEEFDQLAKLDDEWRDYMAQSSSYTPRSQDEDEKRQFFFDSIATQETLQQHLMGQLNQTALDANDRKTAEVIIGNIDDSGFLQSSPEDMSMNTGIPQEEFENMLTLIQSFYPPGVGARDLRECLLIQLKREGKGNSLEYKIISDHMQDLGNAVSRRSRGRWASAPSRCRSAPTTSRSSIRGPARSSPSRRRITCCQTSRWRRSTASIRSS
jgi:RNA polymerase sigma-54 factor